ncbi:MAG: hypothetical protein R3314_02845 [Longimicrobiales bacterium]|nr:hypothetical protein [Longimicrobiales bacterium]
MRDRLRRIFRQLEDRGVLRAVGLYAAGSFVVLQVADLILPALPVPESTYDVVVLLTLLGFPLAVAAAWLFDLTEEGMQRSPASLSGYEAEARSPSARRVRLISATTILALVLVAGGLLAFRTLLRPGEGSGRVTFAAFPFTAETTEWAEGVPDLLLTALDGAEPIRVLDPWSLWAVLRDGPGDSADVPEPERAALIASDRGAQRYLLGAVRELGARVELIARLYRTGRTEPLESFRVGGPLSEMTALVDRLAIEVMNRLASDMDPSLAPLQRNATESPEALKAYLAARAAMRRGQVDSAVAAVDRAVALDSTFALAWLESVQVYSWAQHMRGEFYSGLMEKLDRAEAYAEALTGRNRLRLDAARALLRTDGPAAASAFHRILEKDSTDLQAWAGLAYCHMVYGWQYGTEPVEALRASGRALALDSLYVPGLATRAWLAVVLGDSAAVREVRQALEQHADESYLGRTTLDGLRALTVPDSVIPAMAERLARRGVGDWVAPYRYLRVQSPDRAALMLRSAAAVPDPQIAARVKGEQFRLGLARGRLLRLTRDLEAGRYPALASAGTANRFLVAAGLVGVADAVVAGRAARSLAATLPPDSALAYFESRPVWWTAWILGAYEAQLGDTAGARVWQEVIGRLPEGGTSPDYRGALQADIDARLLVRRGELEAAIPIAVRALELWGIHTENDYEAMPAPQIRFHLASLREATGDTAGARALFRSLVPPTSWFGFLTARSRFELAGLAERAGDLEDARHHYERALALWAAAEGSAADWRRQARRGWTRVTTD